MEELQLSAQFDSIAKKLDNNVIALLGAKDVNGFQKAYMVAQAIQEISALLTPEYMKPIMKLQGNKLGFKTDKDLTKDGAKGPGYPEEIVKNCLIEAVLNGLQPVGNQFNIIAGNCYATKEGLGYVLSKMEGLQYKIVPSLPRINPDKSSAAIVMKVEYSINGVKKTEELDIPVKMNAYMGTDAVIGKATRKARAWLYNNINGVEISDGDIQDVDATVVSSKMNSGDKATVAEEKENERIRKFIESATSVEQLDSVYEQLKDEHMDLFLAKKAELTPKQ